MDLNSHKEKAEQQTTTSPEEKAGFRHLLFRKGVKIF
jgi:hypothetical protein